MKSYHMPNARVVCKDGVTKVFHGDTDITRGVTGIEIYIEAGELIRASITYAASIEFDSEVDATIHQSDADAES